MKQNSTSPRHKQIKEDIVQDILTSVYAPGDMIPKQEDLARQYGVSRLTVRKAIDDLIEKGILRSEKGKGTFVQAVAHNTYSYRRLSGFTSNVVSQSALVSSQVLAIEQLAADKRLSTKLRIPMGSGVVHISRLRYLNKVCVSLQKSYFALGLVEEIDFAAADLDHGSLYEVLRQHNIHPSYVDEHFRAIRASAEVAGHFGVEEGDPVLHVTRVTYNMDDVPIEYCENFESSDVNGIWVKSISI